MQGDENITQQKKVDEDIFFCEGKNNNNNWIVFCCDSKWAFVEEG